MEMEALTKLNHYAGSIIQPFSCDKTNHSAIKESFSSTACKPSLHNYLIAFRAGRCGRLDHEAAF
jgi:hypothetical protein